MAVSDHCLLNIVVLSLGVLAVQAFPAANSTEGCSHGAIVNKYEECENDAPPPPVSNGLDGSRVPAEFFRTFFQEACSITRPASLQCFEDWVESENCDNSEELIDKASRTGSVCEGTSPAQWLQEGLLEKAVDFHEECYSKNAEVIAQCTQYFSNMQDSEDYDKLIECLKERIVPNITCDKMAVFSVIALPALIKAPFGFIPNPDTLASFKDIQF